MTPNMERLEQIVSHLPRHSRVDIEAWGGEPTFRVNGKNFVFTNPEATRLTVKLSKDEAEAVVSTDQDAVPTGYGLGRAGWVTITIGKRVSKHVGARSRNGCGPPTPSWHRRSSRKRSWTTRGLT